VKIAGAAALVAYLTAVAIAVSGARGTDPPQPVSTSITRNDPTDEASVETLRTQLAEWRRTARRRALVIRRQRRMLARRFAYDPGHWLEQAFLCIHTGEGSWTDRGAPYWGGLQMNGAFMQTYGGDYWRVFGTADEWPPSVQIAVAIRAWFTRGFHPWPTTARRCGLL